MSADRPLKATLAPSCQIHLQSHKRILFFTLLMVRTLTFLDLHVRHPWRDLRCWRLEGMVSARKNVYNITADLKR
jgi:hypothetical protein